MTLTPADIHNTEFAKASLGRRGYDENDVDALLDEATGEMIRLLEDNDALRTRLDAGAPVNDRDEGRRAAQAELSAATAALDRAHRACDRAERDTRHVRQQLDEAHQVSAAATSARGEASPGPVLTMAQHTASAYLGEAQNKSRALLTEAHQQARRTLRDARIAADAIDRKSHDHRNQAEAELVTDRERVAHDIDELTRFGAEYHSALERHLRSRGQLFDGMTGR